jgi:hypothetical protein
LAFSFRNNIAMLESRTKMYNNLNKRYFSAVYNNIAAISLNLLEENTKKTTFKNLSLNSNLGYNLTRSSYYDYINMLFYD